MQAKFEKADKKTRKEACGNVKTSFMLYLHVTDARIEFRVDEKDPFDDLRMT